MYKKNDVVYVSLRSRSRVAGEVCTVVRHTLSLFVDEVVVKTPDGRTGYVPSHLVSHHDQRETAAARSHVQAEDGYTKWVPDTDVAHMYLTQIKPLVIDPTDLLCKAVRFDSPFHRPTWGWVSDQWIDEGVELLNVVHEGSFTVVPRSFITHSIA